MPGLWIAGVWNCIGRNDRKTFHIVNTKAYTMVCSIFEGHMLIVIFLVVGNVFRSEAPPGF